jgi:Na+-transporting NADH:ubiquinone oxidoreductase subunit B
MKALRNLLDAQKHLFEKGGKFEKLHPLFEAIDTFTFVPDHVTKSNGVQIRDALDMKRLMMTVIIAMIPALVFGIYNVGFQHYRAIGEAAGIGQMFGTGLLVVLPIILVSYASGGLVEVVFAIVRKHPVNEGFLVTGMLVPLVMPPTIPLWQVAMANIFAVVIAKEVFGGLGMNILNIALTSRAFLYFAYPQEISGDVWTYFGGKTAVDGFSGATPLAVAYEASSANAGSITEALAATNSAIASDFYSFGNLFMGLIPGSIGETSTLMSLLGALLLVATGVASWKVITGVFAGAFALGLLFNLIGANEYMLLPAHYHLVIGGLAFGAVFMATDPVSCAQTETGKWIYGILIGVLTVLIRVFNPAYPEGIMLAILLMNVFAPLIDFYVVKANKTRRLRRATV